MTLAAVLLAAFLASAQTSPAHPARHSADPWWKHAVFYEIYPRSCQDSNGDGVGDLNGITQRLDYLQSLGVNAIWITPFYPSPQVDFGYDISDYENIDPQYGTLADFDRLLAAAKKRDLRVVMDMVLNHTSDQHAWFKQSRGSRKNPKRDWYVWRDGKVGADGKMHPPNNWQSLFGHSAWQWDAKTRQYYYHRFYAEQPDLNWRNPAVEQAMFAQMRFWLNRGVAGFRLDAIDSLLEDPTLADAPANLDAKGQPKVNPFGEVELKQDLQVNQPGLHAIVKQLRAMVESYPGDRVLIGETYMPNIHELDKWYGGAKRDEVQLPMDTQIGLVKENGLHAEKWRTASEQAETQLHGMPLLVIDNHDNPRMDRFCTPEFGAAATGDDCLRLEKMLATLLFATRDAALMYYGDEIGMQTTPPTRREDVKDPIGVLGWPKEKGRDGERTPMQWTPAKDAGFSTADHTWLPIPPNYVTANVQIETADRNSMLNYYKSLLALRNSAPAFTHAPERMITTSNDADILAWARGTGAIVLCNFSSQPQTFAISDSTLPRDSALHVTLANYDFGPSELKSSGITLPPFGAVVAQAVPETIPAPAP